MEIKKLFERGSVSSSTQTANKPQQVDAVRDQAQQQHTRRGAEDSVSISSLSRQLSQVSQILDDEEAAQSQRVAEIKQAVDDGTFSANSGDVARSIVSFAADS